MRSPRFSAQALVPWKVKATEPHCGLLTTNFNFSPADAEPTDSEKTTNAIAARIPTPVQSIQVRYGYHNF